MWDRSPHCISVVLFTGDISGGMSWGEFIELRDLRSGQGQVDLTRLPCSPPRLERTNALRISPGKVPDLLSRVGIIRVLSSAHDPQITEEKGEGHDFQPCSQAQPTWCDLCGDFIWGLYKQSLRCTSKSHTVRLLLQEYREYVLADYSHLYFLKT